MDFKAIFYDWGGANVALFRLLNGINDEGLNAVMRLGIVAAKHSMFAFYFPLVLVFAWYACFRHKSANGRDKARCVRWAQCLLVWFLSYVAALGWVQMLKHSFSFPRPFIVLPEGSVHVLDSHALTVANASFPSGHAIFAMTIAASLWPTLGAPGKIIMTLIVTWVCLSRIVVGAHFPADVAIGALMALIAVLIIRAVVIRTWRLHAH